MPPFFPERFELPELERVCAGWADRLEQLEH